MHKLSLIKYFFLVVVCFVFISCKTRHAASSSSSTDRIITLKDSEKPSYPIDLDRNISYPEVEIDREIVSELSVEETDADKIVNKAKVYIGTPYRYAGTTANGMDCSGLVYTVFETIDQKLPRTSFAMSGIGEVINEKEAQSGDLIFFKTTNRVRISHVGIISRVEEGVIYFIHASSSLGVIESSLEEKYYSQRMVQINRILP